MARYLLLDVGAGTLDVLIYDDTTHTHYKAVVQSPVPQIAQMLESIEGNIVLTGGEMGGGFVREVLRQKAARFDVAATATAAATIHHDPEVIHQLGIRIVDELQAARLTEDQDHVRMHLTDLQIDRLRAIVQSCGVPFAFDVVAVCAQDHGIPPEGVSHLDYRHNLFRSALEAFPHPASLLHRTDEVPPTFNRLCTLAADLNAIPTAEAYVMDSGMAAVLGASQDISAVHCQKTMVLDVATSHTVGATLLDGEIAGFFEYHTADIDLPKMERLIRDLADGRLDHRQVLGQGGHGAYLRRAIGFEEVQAIVVTGPRRRLLADSGLDLTFGAPLGDNMMTGTLGLLTAIRRRKGLPPLPIS